MYELLKGCQTKYIIANSIKQTSTGYDVKQTIWHGVHTQKKSKSKSRFNSSHWPLTIRLFVWVVALITFEHSVICWCLLFDYWACFRV